MTGATTGLFFLSRDSTVTGTQRRGDAEVGGVERRNQRPFDWSACEAGRSVRLEAHPSREVQILSRQTLSGLKPMVTAPP
jgi:hypothetical protein